MALEGGCQQLMLRKGLIKLFYTLATIRYIAGDFCDPTKPSDCANHELLLKKLQLYGVKGTLSGSTVPTVELKFSSKR